MRLVRAGVIVPDDDARALVLVALDGPFDAVVDGTIHSLGRLDALVAAPGSRDPAAVGSRAGGADRDHARRMRHDGQNCGTPTCLYI